MSAEIKRLKIEWVLRFVLTVFLSTLLATPVIAVFNNFENAVSRFLVTVLITAITTVIVSKSFAA
jgi:lipopolysaccharide export LptBFGC system permease protein LptF